MTADPYVVSATSLRKTFGRGSDQIVALAGDDINVPAGMVTGLIGPNGAGKSTFIKTILGYLTPSAGQVTILGEAPGSPEATRRIGYLPENPSFPLYLSGREILIYVAQLLGIPTAEAKKEADYLLNEVGIAHAGNRRVRSYSKGMAQRLGLAQALVGFPELLILDEPMSGLDPIGRAQIKRILRERSDRGASIIFCSHILDDVERLSDHVIMLTHGEVKFRGTVDEVMIRDDALWHTVVRAESPPELEGVTWESAGQTLWSAVDLNTARVNDLHQAAGSGAVTVVDLSQKSEDLEDVFVRLAAVGGS